ncbi:hypothetical protein [uncultured Mediterranean phage uvDeep-CGR2-AD10-C281]|nr:hypothetical protein [uncultured Mediterranean phage uvDeep-CGR2-AD10-C281]
MQLPFGEWLPDQPKFMNPGANVAKNVYFAARSYKPFPSLTSYSTNTIADLSKGAGSFRSTGNTSYNFAATKETIYQLSAGAFTDRGAGGKLLTTSYATCTITVSDYASIGADKTITLKKNDGSTIVFTSTTGTASGLLFKVETNNDTTATNLKNTINGHADFSATVASAEVTVTRATVGNENLTNVSSDTARLTTTNFSGGTPLTGSNTDFITFTQFGDYLIVSNGVDAPQYYLMGTSTNFANLSTIATDGTPPIFKVSGVIRDFLVTGNISGATNRVQWSGINDITTWTAGSKQADSQDLPGSGGQIVAITSGEYGYIFRQNEIVRLDYVGGTTIFRFSVVSPNRGAVYGKTVCQDNRRVFFYADDGFFEVQGDNIKPIGAEKVNRFFDIDLDKAYSDRIVAAVDPFNTLAIWLYPSADNQANTTGICDKLLIYNYVTEKWSFANASASTIFSQFVGAYTVETMDLIDSSIDNINIALDTDFWLGGQRYLGAIDGDNKAAIFSGNSNEVEIETSEIELFPGLRSDITEVRPIVDATATVAITTRERLANSASTSSYSSMVTSGTVPVRQSGRYVRANVKIAAGSTWTHAQGVDFVASRAGQR